jgi:protein phosphatase
MNIKIPELSMVVLMGPSGSGKSSFARKHFKATEILSSDYCRGLVADDENDQAATKDAFDVLHYVAGKRLAGGKLTVVDATNVRPEDRKKYVELAREYHCLPVAIILNMPEALCQERNQQRPDRNFGSHVVRNHANALRKSLRGLEREGFRHVYILNSPEDVETVTLNREPLWNNLKHLSGPFDIIGDVHGCCDELEQLLAKLGYRKVPMSVGEPARERVVYAHPEGRTAVFLGDLVDRGPRIVETLYLVKDMVEAGTALAVPGNHDLKLLRKLRGKDVRITHGLQDSLDQIDALDDAAKAQFMRDIPPFLDSLISHYVLDGGNLVVAHAGMKESMQGRGSGKVREFAMYGETTGETDEFGLPVRFDWASEYRGKATVVYGHTPARETEWVNRTICIDTGCVFGGSLTALRYPEKELVSVPAAMTYCEPVKPLIPEGEQAPRPADQQRAGNMLDINDVLGKRIVNTRLQSSITVREENAIAALEVMSRFAVDPRWLVYLPPTMSPSETTREPGLLEHPAEAFSYFRNQGVPTVVCEEKHMGSRAVVVVCKDEGVAQKRFGISGEGQGVCYTRTGRRFFEDRALEAEFIGRISRAMGQAGLWDELNTDWVCLDTELMPWSAKAQELVKQQYAAVGAASQAALPTVVQTLQAAAGRGLDVGHLLGRFEEKAAMTRRYVEAYRHYCWPVASIADLKLAPFHILASEGQAHVDKDHRWHMGAIARLCQADPELLFATAHKFIDLTDQASLDEGIAWWLEMTGKGGEGMVVKPLDFIAKGRKGLVQPAVKCRGPEYLRIIYGPEYTAPDNLERLRSRGLATKRSLALREFALGVEALERFVRQEPLYRVHECVFGVLAMESEPVDPRL